MKKTILLFSILLSIAAFANNNKGDIKLNIKNIRNNKGKVLISLCNDKKQFKGKGLAIKNQALDIDGDKVEAVFKDIEYGEYAIIILHDENNNQKLDLRFIIPKEGYGASNNKVTTMGPPKYDKSVFTHNKQLLEMDINMVYIGKK